jgi:hypothetical protein
MATDIVEYAAQYGPWGLVVGLVFLLAYKLVDGGFTVELKACVPKRR